MSFQTENEPQLCRHPVLEPHRQYTAPPPPGSRSGGLLPSRPAAELRIGKYTGGLQEEEETKTDGKPNTHTLNLELEETRKDQMGIDFDGAQLQFTIIPSSLVTHRLQRQ